MTVKKEFYNALPIILILSTQELFIPFPQGAAPDNYIQLLVYTGKLVPLVSLVYALYKIDAYTRQELSLFLLVFFYFLYLVFESLFLYNSFFQYPHVMLKIMDLFMGFALIAFYKKRAFNFVIIMNFIVIGLCLKIALNPNAINPTAFVETERAVPSDSVFMLLLPCIYFFNEYLIKLDRLALVRFLFLLFFIMFFQHRSVWTAALGALIFDIFIQQNQKQLNIKKIIPTFLILSLLILFLSSIALSYLPSVADKISIQINNIINPQNDTTGSWRIMQYESYWPFVKQHFLFGMRFQGFELPIQFFHPEAGTEFFKDGTGHHFHSFYYDKLFYFGFFGLMIYLMFLITPILNIILYKNRNYGIIQISLISFLIGGIIYGIPYNLPSFFWIFVGMTYVYLNTLKTGEIKKTVSF